MTQSMYIAASGALAQQMRLEVLANNLSNANSAGFKEDKTVFRQYLPTPGLPGYNLAEATNQQTGSSLPASLGDSYVKFEGTITDFSPGEITSTGNVFDFALNGKGFFCVGSPTGVQYTRNGSFTLNKNGELITKSGLPVLGNGGPIKIDSSDFSVDEGGNVSVNGAIIDKIKIVTFPEKTNLQKVGDNLFSPVDPQVVGGKAEGVEVKQGFIEQSNVNTVKIMTEMIETLRAFEAYQKIIQSTSDVTSKAIDEVGRLQ
jgi:flagellar basal-body rod protein FlgF